MLEVRFAAGRLRRRTAILVCWPAIRSTGLSPRNASLRNGEEPGPLAGAGAGQPRLGGRPPKPPADQLPRLAPRQRQARGRRAKPASAAVAAPRLAPRSRQSDKARSRMSLIRRTGPALDRRAGRPPGTNRPQHSAREPVAQGTARPAAASGAPTPRRRHGRPDTTGSSNRHQRGLCLRRPYLFNAPFCKIDELASFVISH